MVTQTVKCYHCGSEQVKKNGRAPNGKQRYHCRDCNRASLDHPDYGYSEERKAEVIRAYQERSSMRGVARTFGVSRTTLGTWLKKSRDDATAGRHPYRARAA